MIQVIYKTDVGLQNLMDNIVWVMAEKPYWYEESDYPICKVVASTGTVFLCSRSRENLPIRKEAQNILVQAETVEDIPAWFLLECVDDSKVFLFREDGSLYLTKPSR